MNGADLHNISKHPANYKELLAFSTVCFGWRHTCYYEVANNLFGALRSRLQLPFKQVVVIESTTLGRLQKI